MVYLKYAEQFSSFANLGGKPVIVIDTIARSLPSGGRPLASVLAGILLLAALTAAGMFVA